MNDKHNETEESQKQQQDFIEERDEFAESLDPENFQGGRDDDFVPDEELSDFDDSSSDDAAFAGDDSDLSDDEWAEDFDETDYQNDPFEQAGMGDMPAGTNRNWFNIAVVGFVAVGVIGLLAIFVPRMLGGGDTAGDQPFVAAEADGDAILEQITAGASPDENASLAEQAVAPRIEEIEQAGGLLSNPELLGSGLQSPERPDPEAADNAIFEAIGNGPALNADSDMDVFAELETTQPAPAVPVQELPVAADEVPPVPAAASVPRAPQEASPQPTGIASLPVSQDNGFDFEALSEPAEEPEPAPAPAPQPVAQTESAPPVGVDEDRLAELDARLNAVFDRLDALSQRIEGMAAAPQPAPAQAQGANVQAMEETIARLENRIESLSRERATQPSQPAPTPRVTETRPTPAPAPARAAPRPQRPAPEWELRGASRGTAYLAQKGSRDLRTVAVGDTLAGLGRITAIRQGSDGRWTVQGTQGSVTR